MTKIIIGTTPTITYKFNVVSVSDISYCHVRKQYGKQYESDHQNTVIFCEVFHNLFQHGKRKVSG